MDKTVTVKGFVYDLDTVYEDKNGCAGFLRTVDTEGLFELNMNGKTWHCEALEEARFELGGIGNAPLELEDGEYYSFMFHDHASSGIYRKRDNAFANAGHIFCELSSASEIKKLSNGIKND